MYEPPLESAPSGNWVTRLGVKFHRLRLVARSQWWIPTLCISLGLLAAGIMVAIKPVRFRSVGQLMVSERFNLPENVQFSEEQYNFIGTQLKLLESPDVQDRARRRLALEDVSIPPDVSIAASLAPRTSIFLVSGTGPDPVSVQRFVDAAMEEYINYKREKRLGTADTTRVQLSDELARLRDDLNRQERELHAFVEANNMAFWEEQGKTAAEFLSDLKTQEANLRTEHRRLETLSSEELLNRGAAVMSRRNQEGENQLSQSDSPISSDLNLQYLQKSQELIQKQAEFADRSQVWKPKHPRLIALNNEINNLERLIETIKDQTKQSANARIAAIQAELKSVGESIETWEAKVLEASRKDAEYQRLNSALGRTQNLYEKLLLSFQTLDVGRTVAQETLQIMEHASPGRKVPRETLKHLLAGLFVGVFLSGGILFLFERADDRIVSVSELMEQFSEPVLAQIPEIKTANKDAPFPVIRPDDERFGLAEAFRGLRSSLLFLPGDPIKTMLITSTVPSEGKSTISANLAITLAIAGSKVLLVDSDLRRGDVANLFDLDGRKGLSSVLRGELDWRDAIQEGPYPLLSIIPRGPVANQSGELLLASKVQALLEEFKSEFDVTIFNSPPILATDDTPTIAPYFDGVLMVIRAQYTAAHLAKNALNNLYQRQVRVVGIGLNRIDSQLPDYHYYRYSNYYSAT